MRLGDLIETPFAEDNFFIVKNFKLEVFSLIQSTKILISLEQFNIDSCRSVIILANNNLFFKDNAILGRLVLVRVFNWFTVNALFQSKSFTIGQNINV